MRHGHDGAGESGECLLQLLDHLEVEVVRRLVEHEDVDPERLEEGEVRRASSRPARASGRAAPPPRPRRPKRPSNVLALPSGSPAAAQKGASNGSTVAKRARSWSSSPIRAPGPSRRRPAARGQLPEERLDQRRLPRAVPAHESEPFAPAEVELERAETEGPALDDGTLETSDHVPGSHQRAQLQAQLPRTPGLLDAPPLERLEPALRRPYLRAERPGGATVRLPAPATCVRAPLVQQLREALALARVLLEGCLLVSRRRARSHSNSANPPAYARGRRVSASSSSTRFTVRPRKTRSCETRTKPPPRRPPRNRSSRFEPLEVQVVRRLVEQQDVEAGEEDSGQASPRRLSSRQRRHRPVETSSRGACRRRRHGPVLEVSAAERQEDVERNPIRIGELRLVARTRGERVHGRLGLAHSGTAGEVREQGLGRPRVELLRQVADDELGGRPAHDAGIRRLQAGHDAKQGRLADAVRPDQREAGARPDGERDTVDDRRRS